MDMSNDSNKLLSFLKKHFGNHHNFSADDYIHAYGTEADALLYSVLFFPDLLEIENSVFLKRTIINEQAIQQEILESHRSLSEIEKRYNFVEVGYLFDCNGRNGNDDDELFLAHKIQTGWFGWLKIKYPSRDFCVEILTPEQTGSTVGVQFFELRFEKM